MNSKQTTAELAVAIFMEGTIAEVLQILQIGNAIVAHRSRAAGVAGAGPATPPVRRKPGPKPKPAAGSTPTTGPTLVPPTAAQTETATAPPAQVVGATAATPGPRRRRRPAVEPTSAADAAAGGTLSGELPSQEIVDESFVPD